MKLFKPSILAMALLWSPFAIACPASLNAILKSAYPWATPHTAPNGAAGLLNSDYFIALPKGVTCKVVPQKSEWTIIAVAKEYTKSTSAAFDSLDLMLVDSASGTVRSRVVIPNELHDSSNASKMDFAFLGFENKVLSTVPGKPMIGVLTSLSSNGEGRPGEPTKQFNFLRLFSVDNGKMVQVANRNIFSYAPLTLDVPAGSGRKSCGDVQQDIHTITALTTVQHGRNDLKVEVRKNHFLCEKVDGKDTKSYPQAVTDSYTLKFDGEKYVAPSKYY